MVDVAEHPPPSMEVFEKFQRAGRAWVVVPGDDRPVGFVVVDLIDGAAHIEQVSVHPSYGRRGLGRLLIEHACRWASGQGLAAITLTTFRNVAWNGPYYARRSRSHRVSWGGCGG
jgi:ribosomal protein S18 acetylase RimI-like enzyme